jgi:hypothetical protein
MPVSTLSPEVTVTPVSRPGNPTAPASQRRSRAVALAGALAILVALLFGALALPAAATTSGNVGSGVGVPQTRHNTASRPAGSSGALVFGAICLAGMVATAGGVLWHTVRTRRTLD